MSRSSRTPEEAHFLEHFNTRVPYYLWAVIGSIFAVSVAINVFFNGLASRRRARARNRPADFCEKEYCTRHIPGAALSVWRKSTVSRSRLAETLYLGSTGQVLLIAAYFGANLVLMLVHTGNTLNYTAHHAARLVVGNMPLVIGLASKNNIISYCTGFSYASLNALHRWAARWTLLLTIIHVAGRSIVNVPPVDPSLQHNGYIRWGIVAFIISGWMIISAARPIRNRFYQFFVLQHVTCFFIYFTALWVHRPRIYPFIIAGIFLYLVDRVARTGRIIYHHSFRSFIRGGRNSRDQNSTVEALSKDTVRVTIDTNMRWKVGQHVYLHVPLLHAGGHPFSIASICDPLITDEDEQEEADPVAKVRLIIRVREGMTRRLRDYAGEPITTNTPANIEAPPAEAGVSRIYAWAEGAYGNLQHLDEFETLLLVAGGTGVSFTLPVMLGIVRRSAEYSKSQTRSNKRTGRGDVATSRLVFVWTIKHSEDFEWIGDEIRAALSVAPIGLLDINIYITQNSKNTAQDSTQPSLSSPVNPSPPEKQTNVSAHELTSRLPANLHKEPKSSPGLTFHKGRPNIQKTLASCIEQTQYTHHVGVGACGPAQMTQAVSEAVRKEIWPSSVVRGEARRSIFLLVEEYGW